MNAITATYETNRPGPDLRAENERLRRQLDEANETINAIRTGQIDALVVQGAAGNELYTLKTADQTYRVFIETMNEGAVTLNTDGLVVYANSMFADMLAIRQTQVIGTGFDRFVRATDREACRRLIDGGWRVKSKMEVTLLNGAGRDVPCLLSVRALDLDDGPSLSVIVTDLTDEKATQLLLRQNNDRLAEANAALEVSNNALNMLNANLQQFAYVASHDLQEPLRKIQQFGNLLRLTYPDALGEQGADWIGRMESAAARMSVLIRDLLAYSRLTVPVDAVVEQPLNAIVTDVLGVLDLAIRETGAVLEVDDLGTVPGDASQLGQVFQNLIGNALKFVRPDVPPRISVSRRDVRRAELPPLFRSATTHQRFCALRVTDNGIGFDAQQAERIFGTFQRLHGKHQYPGTGIGLAIVKRVAENHRGFVTAEGQPGAGATFTVYLPVVSQA